MQVLRTKIKVFYVIADNMSLVTANVLLRCNQSQRSYFELFDWQVRYLDIYLFYVYDCVDIGASAKLESVDKFCYLGDMLSVVGDADAAVETRIRIGWNKFRQLVPLLTNKDVSLIMRGRLYSSCV